MKKHFVLTLTGPDRVGIVDRVTGLVLERGGNVETSRMARLGGEFAVLMLVSLSSEHCTQLDRDLEGLAAEGYKLTTTQAEPAQAASYPDGRSYRIEVEGADHEGIIHEVAHYLSHRGINIESMDSETTAAPISGVPLFTMTAQVVVPASLEGRAWEVGLNDIGSRMNLEIRVCPEE